MQLEIKTEDIDFVLCCAVPLPAVIRISKDLHGGSPLREVHGIPR
jgi:hypothetical protein